MIAIEPYQSQTVTAATTYQDWDVTSHVSTDCVAVYLIVEYTGSTSSAVRVRMKGATATILDTSLNTAFNTTTKVVQVDASDIIQLYASNDYSNVTFYLAGELNSSSIFCETGLFKVPTNFTANSTCSAEDFSPYVSSGHGKGVFLWLNNGNIQCSQVTGSCSTKIKLEPYRSTAFAALDPSTDDAYLGGSATANNYLIGQLADDSFLCKNESVTPIGTTASSWNDLEDIEDSHGAMYYIMDTTGGYFDLGFRKKGSSLTTTFNFYLNANSGFIFLAEKGTSDIVQYYRGTAYPDTITRLAFLNQDDTVSYGAAAAIASTVTLGHTHNTGEKLYLADITTPVADYRMLGSFNYTADSGQDVDAGYVARYQDQDNYLLAYGKTATTGSGYYIDKVVSGTRSNISSSLEAVSGAKEITFTFQGTSLKLDVGGVSKIDTTDSAITTAGEFGLYFRSEEE